MIDGAVDGARAAVERSDPHGSLKPRLRVRLRVESKTRTFPLCLFS